MNPRHIAGGCPGSEDPRDAHRSSFVAIRVRRCACGGGVLSVPTRGARGSGIALVACLSCSSAAELGAGVDVEGAQGDSEAVQLTGAHPDEGSFECDGVEGCDRSLAVEQAFRTSFYAGESSVLQALASDECHVTLARAVRSRIKLGPAERLNRRAVWYFDEGEAAVATTSAGCADPVPARAVAQRRGIYLKYAHETATLAGEVPSCAESSISGTVDEERVGLYIDAGSCAKTCSGWMAAEPTRPPGWTCELSPFALVLPVAPEPVEDLGRPFGGY